MDSHPPGGYLPAMTLPTPYPLEPPPPAPPSAPVYPRQGGGGKALRVALVVLVTLAALGAAAGTLPKSVARARAIAYPLPRVGVTMRQVNGPLRLGETVSFDALVRAGNELALTWDFGDGATGQGAQVSHIYTVYGSDGAYNVTLDAVDPIGQQAQTQLTVHVLPTQPVAAFTASINPSDPFEMDFDASTSFGDVLQYYWKFGDGSLDTSGGDVQGSHFYYTSGTYTVTLIVRDVANQRATVSHTVKVAIP